MSVFRFFIIRTERTTRHQYPIKIQFASITGISPQNAIPRRRTTLFSFDSKAFAYFPVLQMHFAVSGVFILTRSQCSSTKEFIMDVYPLTYKNLIFNIITDEDISFVEIRKLLDYLIEEQAFDKSRDSLADDPEMYEIYIDDYYYVVDVQNYEVAIYKREKKIDVMEN